MAAAVTGRTVNTCSAEPAAGCRARAKWSDGEYEGERAALLQHHELVGASALTEGFPRTGPTSCFCHPQCMSATCKPAMRAVADASVRAAHTPD